MRRIREEKAITLIALIITIIVLLILAVVAINAVTGDGIIQHASNAKTSYENAQAVENSMIGEYESYLDRHNPNKKIISFSCRVSQSFSDVQILDLEAEEGMTWYEWCESSYNTVGFYCSNINSEINLKETLTDYLLKVQDSSWNIILGSETIEENKTYYVDNGE